MNNENFYATGRAPPRRGFFSRYTVSSAVKFGEKLVFSPLVVLRRVHASQPDIKSAMDTGGKVSVKSGPSICFNNSVKEDYFLGLLLPAIKQRGRNPSSRGKKRRDAMRDARANHQTSRLFLSSLHSFHSFSFLSFQFFRLFLVVCWFGSEL